MSQLSAKKSTRLFAATAALFVTSSTFAQVVGPGIGTANDELDGTGARTNIDNAAPVAFAAGSYTASLFNFDAGQAGDVTPFLATGDGTNFTVIAVGTTQNPAGVSTDQSVPFGVGGFTLAAPATVYAGIYSATTNPIFLDNFTASPIVTDHDTTTPDAPVVNGTYTATTDAGYSNPDLGRQYAFSVTVVPEPTALGLLGLGAVGLLARRRRA